MRGSKLCKVENASQGGVARRIAETDEAGIITLFNYDKLGRLIQVINDYRAEGYTTGKPPIGKRNAKRLS